MIIRSMITVTGPESFEPDEKLRLSDARVAADMPAMLEAVEEDLQDLLPDGYTVRITAWEETPDE